MGRIENLIFVCCLSRLSVVIQKNTRRTRMIGGLGMTELIIILVIVLVIFGAGKLPEVGGALGKGIKNFKSSMSDTSDDKSVKGDIEDKSTKEEEIKPK
jgi:sec-independent protein translocase protein TatA